MRERGNRHETEQWVLQPDSSTARSGPSQAAKSAFSCSARSGTSSRLLTIRNKGRIIRFFGSVGHDWIRINFFKKGLEERIALEGPDIHTVEQLEKFIA